MNRNIGFVGRGVAVVVVCVLLGCGGLPLWNEVWTDDGSALDYVRLFEIADLVLDRHDKQANVAGLTAIFGAERTQAFVRWFGVVSLALEAAQVLDGRLTSRDLDVAEVTAQYRAADRRRRRVKL